jgi:hypothetical protein
MVRDLMTTLMIFEIHRREAGTLGKPVEFLCAAAPPRPMWCFPVQQL